MHINGKIYRYLAWIGVALQATALIHSVFFASWGGAISLTIFLLLSIAFLLINDRLPSLLALLIIATALVNAGGWAVGLFNKITVYDDLVHAFTSFALVAALAYLAWTPGSSSEDSVCTRGKLLATTAAGLLIGAIWELGEAISLSLEWGDTIVDLVMDGAGGAMAAPFAMWAIRKSHNQTHPMDIGPPKTANSVLAKPGE